MALTKTIISPAAGISVLLTHQQFSMTVPATIGGVVILVVFLSCEVEIFAMLRL